MDGVVFIDCADKRVGDELFLYFHWANLVGVGGKRSCSQGKGYVARMWCVEACRPLARRLRYSIEGKGSAAAVSMLSPPTTCRIPTETDMGSSGREIDENCWSLTVALR